MCTRAMAQKPERRNENFNKRSSVSTAVQKWGKDKARLEQKKKNNPKKNDVRMVHPDGPFGYTCTIYAFSV